MISVLMSVYKKDQPAHFDLAIKSIYEQTFKDFELVLVADGPLTDGLHKVLNNWKEVFGGKMKIICLKENQGLAKALNEGLNHCSFDLVARMDSDDYSEPDRLKIQYDFMGKHSEVDLLGSYIGEFIDNENKIILIREVPLSHEDIVKKMWFQNPINHVTVMFRKKSVLEVGKYDPFYGDDDFLWAKMLTAGKIFQNLSLCLVRVRIGNDMHKRRGVKLFCHDFRVKKYLLKNKKMNFIQFIFITSILLVFRIMPSFVRKILYFRIRKKVSLNV